MTDSNLGDVFVTGDIDLLTPALHWLALKASSITIVSRSTHEIAEDVGATTLKFDWQPDGLARRVLAARNGTYDLAIVWLPDEAGAFARPVENLVRKDGRIIRVYPTLPSDPILRRLTDPDPRSDVIRQSVILRTEEERSRKAPSPALTDIEVSGGVMAAIRDPALARITVAEHQTG